MLEYRFSVDDDELDDFEETTPINVDDDMGDYGEEEEDELVVVVTPALAPLPLRLGNRKAGKRLPRNRPGKHPRPRKLRLTKLRPRSRP